jgi:hypothetical protein
MVPVIPGIMARYAWKLPRGNIEKKLTTNHTNIVSLVR